MSDTMQEGVIASWQKKVGDKVKSGDVLAEVETDKATMELESYEDGTLLYIGHEAGKSVPVNGVLAVIGEQGADFQALLAQEEGGSAPAGEGAGAESAGRPYEAPEASGAAYEEGASESRIEESKTDPQMQNQAQATHQPSEVAVAPGQPAPEGQQAAAGTDGRIFISPLARKMAEERGINLGQVRGSGENGRIVRRDIENFQPSAAPQPAARPQAQPGQQPQQQGAPAMAAAPAAGGEGRYTEQPVSQMRKVIARRLAESMFTAPHFYLTMAIDMDEAWSRARSMNAMSPVKISFNDIVIKAAAAALRQHPAVNSSWLGDKIRYQPRHQYWRCRCRRRWPARAGGAQRRSKPLSQIAAEVKDFGARAKSKKLQPQTGQASTFTISNLGMFGIEEFTAIINPPDACILAVGAIQDVPVVSDGQIVPGKVMKVTMSCDHRVVDGAVGSAFLQTLKQLLEDPIRMLV